MTKDEWIARAAAEYKRLVASLSSDEAHNAGVDLWLSGEDWQLESPEECAEADVSCWDDDE